MQIREILRRLSSVFAILLFIFIGNVVVHLLNPRRMECYRWLRQAEELGEYEWVAQVEIACEDVFGPYQPRASDDSLPFGSQLERMFEVEVERARAILRDSTVR